MSEERLGLDELAALDPGPVRELADHLSGAAGGLGLVEGLLPSAAPGWSGAGADAGLMALGMRRAVVSAARETFSGCAKVLAAHARTIEDVRARARWLVVDRRDLDRYDANAASAGIVAQERERLAAKVRALAEALAVSASAAEVVVGRGAGDAPAGPTFEEQVTDGLASLGTGVALGLEGAAVTAWTFVRLTPAYAERDPEGSARTREQVEAAFRDATSHPVDSALAVLDVETARDDPVMWVGKLAPAVAVGLATDGVGSVGGVAAAGARGVGAGSRVQKVVGSAADQGVSVAGGSAAAGTAAQERAARAPVASPGYRAPGNPMAAELPAAEGSRRREERWTARGGRTRAITVPPGAAADPADPADPPMEPTTVTRDQDQPGEPACTPR